MSERGGETSGEADAAEEEAEVAVGVGAEEVVEAEVAAAEAVEEEVEGRASRLHARRASTTGRTRRYAAVEEVEEAGAAREEDAAEAAHSGEPSLANVLHPRIAHPGMRIRLLQARALFDSLYRALLFRYYRICITVH